MGTKQTYSHVACFHIFRCNTGEAKKLGHQDLSRKCSILNPYSEKFLMKRDFLFGIACDQEIEGQ